eukprot:363456_1
MATAIMELVVWNFVRTEYEEPFDHIDIPMPLKYLIRNFSNPVIGSKLITIKEDLYFIELLLTKLSNIYQFKLLYRASENNYLANKFHELCDGYGHTITIIKNNHGHIFGGYTKEKWTSKHGWVHDENAFLFLIRSSDSSQKCPILFEVHANPSRAIFHNQNGGPIFGGGYAICISDKCNEQTTSSRSFNRIMFNQHASVFNYKGNQLCGGIAKTKNALNINFIVEDYEIFEVNLCDY